MSVRVRYAPSPTGSPHVGNIRTALYNHLFAKRFGGVNILRIEDTDRARAIEGCEEDIIESLRYVGVLWQEGPGAAAVPGRHDFGPYRQSERKEAGIYEPHWRRLLEEGNAYWAFDTEDELKEMRAIQEANKQSTGYFGGTWREATPSQIEQAQREGKPGVVRLKIPRGKTIVIEDAVRGRIEYDSNLVDDPVLIKADGMPTYHFAAMVDDHLMEVTHIFRGEEWISSAPKHVTLFKALGWTSPIMVHLPVINGRDGKKLSKRHGDTACLDFRRAGFQGEALANFIALIGWAPGGDREVMSMDEMAEAFDIRGIQPSSGVFDLEKLNWMSGMHIRRTTPDDLLSSICEYADRGETEAYWSGRPPGEGEPNPRLRLKGLRLLSARAKDDRSYALEAVKLEQERVTNLAGFGEACLFFVQPEVEFDPKAVDKWFGEPHVRALFEWLLSRLEGPVSSLDSVEKYEALLREAQGALSLEKLGPVVHPVRVALTGKTTGPGLFELMNVLGKDEVAKRLAAALKELPS
ncbi:MAG: glutamate--tRNA ligase [Armatimonadetes bacterium]|nr:glutamate--tRNA ligase [Armatimonadota bacterium]